VPLSITRIPRAIRLGALLVATASALAACGLGGSASQGAATDPTDWADVVERARGQDVSLWMWGGDEKGNSYVDDILAPAAAKLGITLRRVPIADTQDAITRMLSEAQAGRDDGSVDLVWVNGENFRSGQQAGLWRCGWTDELPNWEFIDPTDSVLSEDFGTPVEGCEVPWHRAQFALAYDAADVQTPPRSLPELYEWARENPGRFTYPAPPDFTGSAFLRQALYASTEDGDGPPTEYDPAAAGEVTAPLWAELGELSPYLWREGQTFPRDVAQLDRLFAQNQVSFTMTYGPATLDALVADGTFPDTTRVMRLRDGTLANASFLAVPSNAEDADAAMVVANLALSPEQQLAKADPEVWGQYPVLDLSRVPEPVRRSFEELPASTVVPPFDALARNSQPELSADWVAPLERGWHEAVLTR
jgi:putative spermidine/putrescine transport system substrate-binding protein